MNAPLLIYTILPCLVAAYAAAVFLTTRPISAGRAWTLGLLVGTLFTVGAFVAMRPLFSAATPNSTLIKSYASLYFIPDIVLVATAVTLRSRGVNRGVGITVLVAVFLASAYVGQFLSVRFTDFVNAVQ